MPRLIWFLTALVVLTPSSASAYVGPGAGIGAIAAVLGVIAAVFMAFVAVLWYPVKRLFKSKGRNRKKSK